MIDLNKNGWLPFAAHLLNQTLDNNLHSSAARHFPNGLLKFLEPMQNREPKIRYLFVQPYFFLKYRLGVFILSNYCLAGVFHMVFLSAKKCCVFKRACLFYHHITEKYLRQKPVRNGHKKSLKNQGFRWADLGTSKTVVFVDRCYILSCGNL